MKNILMGVQVMITIGAIAILILKPFESLAINLYAVASLLFIVFGLIVVYLFMSTKEAKNQQF